MFRFFGFCLLLCAVSADAQVCRSPQASTHAGDTKGVTVPVSLHSGLVFVPVTVNGSSFEFLLDSGFESSAMDLATARALHLASTDRKSEDAPGGKVETSTVSGVHRSISDIPLQETSLPALDLSGIAPLVGHSIAGILGYDFFQQFVVIVNYQDQQITLCRPDSFEPGNMRPVTVDLKSRQPYMDAVITSSTGRLVHASLEVDTGKVDPFSLNAAFARKSGILPDTSPLLELKGVSLGGETQGSIGRVRQLSFAGVTLHRPVMYISEESGDRDGQIGYGILKGFTITFDYADSRLFMEPNTRFDEPTEFDHAGLMLSASGPEFNLLKVFLVIGGTPAAKAGVKDGDEILSINDKVYTLDAARTFLQQAMGPQSFRIRRGGEVFTAVVNCRPII